ncbi:type IV toxin-antitoxin system AbiEi family antitoxin [Saccharomonospora azurea]|uniref:type IV toxin-antitoxin system AbiEi family antitoxin n=1 Tax=Saccharomonospora azurea TaxID=40988 RepID=UPI0034C5DFF1
MQGDPERQQHGGHRQSAQQLHGREHRLRQRHPVAVTTSPDTEAIASGLRRGAVIVRASVGRLPSRRAETTSRTVVNTGVRIASWNSSTGATTVASPNTYAATGRPRLPALT